MERIVLRHLTGSKANQVEEFPINHIKELVLGRDPTSTVTYDPDKDDLVGRQHARITQDIADSTQFTITDLESRNGTYVNKQRIVGTVKIAPGDLIQLGPGGPEVQFDLEPRPPNAIRATRGVSADPSTPTLSANSVPTTRTIETTPQPSSAALKAPGTVGKATVERMISETITETKKTEGRRYLFVGGAALIAVLVVFGIISLFLVNRSKSSEAEISKVQDKLAGAPMTEEQIVAARRNAVVKLEVSWKLTAANGVPVYQKYGNFVRNSKKGEKTLVPDMSKEAIYPCFVKLKGENAVEPYLTTENSASTYPIAGQYRGTGFVVGNDGYILTTRFNAYAWENEYPLPSFEYALLYEADGSSSQVLTKDELNEKYKVPTSWVPARAKQPIDGTPGRFTGTNDSLYVTFPGTGRRIAGQLITGSEQQDVALIKISLPTPLQAVDFGSDDPSSIKQGNRISMLGYPTDSVRVYIVPKNKGTASNQQKSEIEVAEPNFYSGNIGRLLRNSESNGNRDEVYSEMGDAYQLTINAPTLGNSGSPIFDAYGRVIAIFSVGFETNSTRTFAVPIRYGKELLSSNAAAE
jgi:S1-C subfamily serine protease